MATMITSTRTHFPARGLSAVAPRRFVVAAASRQEGSKNKGQSGIHDSLGWGQRGGAFKKFSSRSPKPHKAGQQRQMQAQAIGDQERSDQNAHRLEAANKEIMDVEKEKVEKQKPATQEDLSLSDDEWEHMSKPKKWWMEAKALLYSWLGTGVEPL